MYERENWIELQFLIDLIDKQFVDLSLEVSFRISRENLVQFVDSVYEFLLITDRWSHYQWQVHHNVVVLHSTNDVNSSISFFTDWCSPSKRLNCSICCWSSAMTFSYWSKCCQFDWLGCYWISRSFFNFSLYQFNFYIRLFEFFREKIFINIVLVDRQQSSFFSCSQRQKKTHYFFLHFHRFS